MTGKRQRRRYTLSGERTRRTESLSVEDIDEFIEQNEERNPEVVSVTVELDDSAVGVGTTN